MLPAPLRRGSALGLGEILKCLERGTHRKSPVGLIRKSGAEGKVAHPFGGPKALGAPPVLQSCEHAGDAAPKIPLGIASSDRYVCTHIDLLQVL